MKTNWMLDAACGLAALLLMACGSSDSSALDAQADTGLLEDDPLEPLDMSAGADGLLTQGGKPRHDPVVFVHGCPLPNEIGSGTNYVTSTYWQPIYEELRLNGYRAKPWPKTEQGTIPRSGGPQPAAPGGGRYTEPAADQYLNVFVHQGPACGSSEDHAVQLADYIERVRAATDSPRVDIVANSLGAIAARLYVQRHGRKRVRDFVILAGVNMGTNMAIVPIAPIPGLPITEPVEPAPGVRIEPGPPFAREGGAYGGAREIFPAYACDGESSPFDPDDLMFQLNGCVADGRSADQTPHDVSEGGAIAYLNIYNVAVDELVNPTYAACLNQEFPGDCRDTRVNLAIQVGVQTAEDWLNESPDSPHGSIRNDEQAICPTVAFLMCRDKSRREPCDINALSPLLAQSGALPPAQRTDGVAICARP